MSRIHGMYFWSDSSAYPCAMTWKQSLWWRFMPGVVINVRWPRGWVVIEEHSDGTRVGTDSADPNDHYRPWLEANVGRQGWDWDWGMADTDATLDRLTIKIRRSQARLATIAVMRWS